jgi:uncharacterized protein YecT (DUF1311 family)
MHAKVMLSFRINLTLLFLCVLLIPIEALAGRNDFWEMCKENTGGFLQCDEVGKVCSQVEFATTPAGDNPTKQERQRLQGCSSDSLYYGYSNPSDSVNARKCAFLQIEQDHFDGPFDGFPTLMTIYANGEGVTKNLDLALKFACKDEGWAPSEYEGRILHLDSLRRDHAVNNKFDYCDDITSGYMEGVCASTNAAIKKAARTKRIAKLMDSWSERDKCEFEKMQTIWQGYLGASAEEVDQSGSARNAMTVENEESQEEDFFTSLLEFKQKKFPTYSNDDFIQTDREMNLLYKRIQKMSRDKSTLMWGTVTKENIRIVQKAWLKYRDAWIAFAKQKYPSVSASAWKTWLTRTRIAQMKPFLDIP